MRMARFILFRLLGVVVVLLVVTAITFVIFYVLPTNPAQLSCGKPCTPQNLAAAKEYLGLDQPWYGQFWEFLKGIVVGRSSIQWSKPVATIEVGEWELIPVGAVGHLGLLCVGRPRSHGVTFLVTKGDAKLWPQGFARGGVTVGQRSNSCHAATARQRHSRSA